jgi:hypothetical protein
MEFMMQYLLKHDKDSLMILSRSGINDLFFELGWRVAAHGKVIPQATLKYMQAMGYMEIDELPPENVK